MEQVLQDVYQKEGRIDVLVNNAVAGGFSEEELATLAKAKSLTSETMVWKPGMSGWMQAKNVPEVQKIILLNP